MSDFKDQHFVPKSFFKLFSDDRVFIGMYNIKRRKSLFVPLSTQCQRAYFYSDDPKQEKSFKEVEDLILATLRSIVKTQSIHTLTENDLDILRLFVLFQRGRTESTKLHAEQASDHFAKLFIKSKMNEPDFPRGIKASDLEKIRIVDQSAFNNILLLHINAVPLLKDLGMALIVNETENDFIFSDNPVVFFNEYQKRIGKPTGSLGFQVPGLQIFCPITPKLCLFFYDVQTYIFSFKIFESKIVAFKKSDIDLINKLQFYNCKDNLYYRSKADCEYVEKMHSEINYEGGRLRKIVTQQREFFDPKNQTLRTQILSSEELPSYSLDLSFIKEYKRFKNLPAIRSLELSQFYQNTIKDLLHKMNNTKAVLHQST